ncbi:MAG: HET-C-related protein, partial [Dehalococcoidia bacterium]
MKKKILSMAILSIVLILAMFSAIPSVEAFDTAIHQDKDDEAFDALAKETPPIIFPDAARDRVNKANKGQDSIFSGIWKAKFHGDRKKGETHEQAFNRTREYIKEELDNAAALFNQSNVDGYDALGRALHAVQDFYAHSNYVELPNAADQAAARAALDDPTQPIPTDIKMCGFWGWPFTCNDAGGWFHYQDPLGYSHTDHNKDNNATKDPVKQAQYAAANAAAVSHTKDILRGIWTHISLPGGGNSGGCGAGYSEAIGDSSKCCPNGYPYYWSSDGKCHT